MKVVRWEGKIGKREERTEPRCCEGTGEGEGKQTKWEKRRARIEKTDYWVGIDGLTLHLERWYTSVPEHRSLMHIRLPKEQFQLLIWQKDQINGHIFSEDVTTNKETMEMSCLSYLSNQKIQEFIDSSDAIFLPSHLSEGQGGSVTLSNIWPASC